MKAPCFIALTRPVNWAGLPMVYAVLLIICVGGGFIATLSFVWLALAPPAGYLVLRAIANYDPRLPDVLFSAVRKTPVSRGWMKRRGISYRV